MALMEDLISMYVTNLVERRYGETCIIRRRLVMILEPGDVITHVLSGTQWKVIMDGEPCCIARVVTAPHLNLDHHSSRVWSEWKLGVTSAFPRRFEFTAKWVVETPSETTTGIDGDW